MMQKKRTEEGQVMILLVLALVGLFAFAALAIDGGMIYSDRRIAQNAADASSMSGVGAAGQEVQWIVKSSWNCASSEVINAQATAVAEAISSAGVNDYTIDADISDDHGVTTVCSDGTDKYLDVVVDITDQTESTFAHLFFNGPLVNTVESVARLHPRFPVAEGFNIISLTDDCGPDKGTSLNGGPVIVLTGGGGMFSNSCFICSGGGTGSLTGDSVFYYNTLTCPNMDLNVPTIEQATDKLQPVIDIDGACDGMAAGTETNVNMGGGVNDITLTPGSYNSISVTDSKDMMHLDPGLYCVSGPVKVLGNLFEGTGVTIALLGTSNPDGFTTAADTLVQLSAAPADCEMPSTPSCNGAIGGLLIWVHPDNSSVIKLTGTADSYYDGTVYGANNEIQIGGDAGVGSSIDYGAQLIGDTIKISGSSTININYDETLFYHTRAKLEVAK